MADQGERVRSYTRSIEFDFVSWTLDALSIKIEQAALGTGHYLSEDEQKQVVLQYLKLISNIQGLQDKLTEIYADPKVSNPQTLAEPFASSLTN